MADTNVKRPYLVATGKGADEGHTIKVEETIGCNIAVPRSLAYMPKVVASGAGGEGGEGEGRD